ncbi:MAG: hypothetical protein H7Y33_02115 [Cytophagales bacterium]|nr:hypothetical protein [Rhizobacter sp.]
MRLTPPVNTGASSGGTTPQPTPAPSVATTSPTESSNPLLPHERDEKVGMTGGAPSTRVQQGARDLKRGLSDTTRAPEADAAYRKLKK